MSRLLHPVTISRIKEYIRLGMGQSWIAKRCGCSIGAVSNYVREHRGGAPVRYHNQNYAKKPVADAKAVPCKPNMLPWMTVEMLTGARAPVAKVRS